MSNEASPTEPAQRLPWQVKKHDDGRCAAYDADNKVVVMTGFWDYGERLAERIAVSVNRYAGVYPHFQSTKKEPA